MSQFLRTPRQADAIFGLNGNKIVLTKNSFLVRFKRVDPSGKSTWKQSIAFNAKSVDRPSITPTIEEVNQYGKKRQITTGYKTSPLRITLYETADCTVQRMWNEYSKWYFGDFAQDNKKFSYDVTSSNMLDNGAGFGYVVQPNTNTVIDQNSQFFFVALEI